jgi:hypothetical protein
MELNALQKKSAKTIAMQNAGMLFFLLYVLLLCIEIPRLALHPIGHFTLVGGKSTKISEVIFESARWVSSNVSCKFPGGCFVDSKFSTNFQSLLLALPT